MEPARGAKNAWAFGMGAREFDGCLDAFAAGAAEERLVDAAPGEPAKPRGEPPGQPGHVRLQHGGSALVEFVFQRGDDARVIMPGIVDAIAGVEIEDDAAVRGKKLGAFAAVIGDIHIENVEQLHPLGIDVLLVEIFAAVEARGLRH